MDETKNKLNCWEFKQCGREPGGAKADELGVCPAALETGADGIHHGQNGGRCCWVVTGSLCKGQRQGSYAEKFGDCQQCDFYELVKNEESPYFRMGLTIINEIKKRGS